jgi:hypothetical protein
MGQTRATEETMKYPFYRSSVENPVIPAAEPIPIQDRPSEIPAAAPSGSDLCAQPFCNARMNSRIGQAVGAHEWSVRWTAELATGIRATSVAENGDRILVHGIGAWQLFDATGRSVASGRLGLSGAYLDPPHGLFYMADQLGFIAARKLADGTEAFVLTAWFGNNFERTLIARRGRRLWVTSIERPVRTRGEYKPSLSVIELRELAEPQRVNHGVLESAREVANLMRESLLTLAALHDETLVVATENHIYVLDTELRINAIVEGKFRPLAFSLDEGMRIYLLAETSQGRALWILTRDGHRIASFTLPDGEGRSGPPIIAYSHHVYLASADHLLAVDARGKLVWGRSVEDGPISGAVTTADDHLLLCAGTSILAWSIAGERRLVWRSEGEALLTAPILTSRGDLLVASGKHLYCLTPH